MNGEQETNHAFARSHSNAGLERDGDLTEYADGLLNRLRIAMGARHSPDARIVSLADLCGAIQLIQAGSANLRDVQRLDWMSKQHTPGATVTYTVNKEPRGTGIGSRRAIDNSMERSNVELSGN